MIFYIYEGTLYNFYIKAIVINYSLEYFLAFSSSDNSFFLFFFLSMYGFILLNKIVFNYKKYNNIKKFLFCNEISYHILLLLFYYIYFNF